MEFVEIGKVFHLMKIMQFLSLPLNGRYVPFMQLTYEMDLNVLLIILKEKNVSFDS